MIFNKELILNLNILTCFVISINKNRLVVYSLTNIFIFNLCFLFVFFYCFSGKPALQLHQLLTSFYLHDTKYTIKLNEVDRGMLAKHPDSTEPTQDLMAWVHDNTIWKRLLFLWMITILAEKSFIKYISSKPKLSLQIKIYLYNALQKKSKSYFPIKRLNLPS